MMAAMLTLGMNAMADNYAYLTVGQDEGETSVEVSQVDKITFDASNMVIHLSDGNEQSLPLGSLSRMFFSETSQGIFALQTSRDKIKYEDGCLRLQLADGERAVIYNMKGEMVYTTNRSTEVTLDNLHKGVYIVRVGNETKKIMSR
jgi:hypothetical protein